MEFQEEFCMGKRGHEIVEVFVSCRSDKNKLTPDFLLQTGAKGGRMIFTPVGLD
jgi:hypothetical protein